MYIYICIYIYALVRVYSTGWDVSTLIWSGFSSGVSEAACGGQSLCDRGSVGHRVSEAVAQTASDRVSEAVAHTASATHVDQSLPARAQVLNLRTSLVQKYKY